MRDELIPAYAYILELLIKEAEEAGEGAGDDERTLHGVKAKRFSATRLHPRDMDITG